MKPRAACHPEREHHGRGLCGPCYTRAKAAGTIDNYARNVANPADMGLFCRCPGGPIRPDGLGECSRCHRITAERARDGWLQFHALHDAHSPA